MSGSSNKDDIRRKILSIRSAQGPDGINLKSNLATGLLLSMGEFASSRSVLFYAATQGEVKTINAVEKSLKMGKKVCLPRIIDGNIRVFEIKSYYEDTTRGAYGIPEPIKGKTVETNVESLDLVIAPGLAFDKRGGRLGFGKGYYDRFLKTISPKAPVIGMAFEFQVIEMVPVTKNDLFVDFIVTEKRIIDCKNVEIK